MATEALLRVSDPRLRSAFASLPEDVRAPCLDLRELIIDVATAIPQFGGIEETLK